MRFLCFVLITIVIFSEVLCKAPNHAKKQNVLDKGKHLDKRISYKGKPNLQDNAQNSVPLTVNKTTTHPVKGKVELSVKNHGYSNNKPKQSGSKVFGEKGHAQSLKINHPKKSKGHTGNNGQTYGKHLLHNKNNKHAKIHEKKQHKVLQHHHQKHGYKAPQLSKTDHQHVGPKVIQSHKGKMAGIHKTSHPKGTKKNHRGKGQKYGPVKPTRIHKAEMHPFNHRVIKKSHHKGKDYTKDHKIQRVKPSHHHHDKSPKEVKKHGGKKQFKNRKETHRNVKHVKTKDGYKRYEFLDEKLNKPHQLHVPINQYRTSQKWGMNRKGSLRHGYSDPHKKEKALKGCAKIRKRKCPIAKRPVCGTDGINYLNKCHLKEMACRKGSLKSITIRHRGECKYV